MDDYCYLVDRLQHCYGINVSALKKENQNLRHIIDCLIEDRLALRRFSGQMLLGNNRDEMIKAANSHLLKESIARKACKTMGIDLPNK